MINSGREWDWMDKKTKMSKEELDNFLLNLLNADKVSIRRKLIYMKKFIEENTILLNQNKDEEVGKSGKVQ